MAENPENSNRLLKLVEVRGKTGKSTSSIYDAIASGTFPRPVKLGPRASAWVEVEVDEWIAERIAERDRGQKAC